LPGALTRNSSLEFRCAPSWLRVETSDTAYTAGCERGSVLQVPVSHGEGRYVADAETLDMLEHEQRVAFRYVRRDGSPVGGDSPNGSMRDIAGIVNERRNVLGMMPHPERACEPLLGSSDGMRLFNNVAQSMSGTGVMPVAATS
ncbi:MAG: phosphoribosylformylglycinamidine synthase subunit PurQ, partial [Candidatus Dormibacteria bacterium]